MGFATKQRIHLPLCILKWYRQTNLWSHTMHQTNIEYGTGMWIKYVIQAYVTHLCAMFGVYICISDAHAIVCKPKAYVRRLVFFLLVCHFCCCCRALFQALTGFGTCFLFATIACTISWLVRIWYRWINKNIMSWVCDFPSLSLCMNVRVCMCLHLIFISSSESMCILSITYARMFFFFIYSFHCSTLTQCKYAI